MGLMPIKITSRQYDVLIRCCKTTEETSKEIGLAYNTTNNHYKRLLAKFDVSNKAGIVIKALKYGIVDIDDFII